MPYRPRPARLIISAVIVLWTAILGGCTRVHKAATGYEQYAGAAVKLPVSAAFGPDRRLWRVVSTEDHVYVDYSKDYGKSFSPPVAINPERIPIRAQSEYRAQIAVDSAGRIYVAYPAFGLQPWTTYLTLSEDQGQHFSAPKPLSDQARVANSYQTVCSRLT
ncbi:MAG TPA: sialidase family protein, partial [Methylococcaceae bacterium]|nr:sialidase family protein [Methylococcaceae bacterium]